MKKIKDLLGISRVVFENLYSKEDIVLFLRFMKSIGATIIKDYGAPCGELNVIVCEFRNEKVKIVLEEYEPLMLMGKQKTLDIIKSKFDEELKKQNISSRGLDDKHNATE